MASDIEAAEHEQVEHAVMAERRDVERVLRVAIIKGIAVAIPAAIAVFVGLVTLAVAGQHSDWAT